MLQKVRINDLARELEVKSKVILDLLIKVGVTEKKTHSSSIEVDEAERVKKYYSEHGEPGSSSSSRSSRAQAEEFKPKIDLSHISKPGDVLRAITQKAATPQAAAPRSATAATPAAPPKQTVAPPSAVPARPPSSVAKPAASAAPVAPVETPKPAPRFITPQSVARPPATITIPSKVAAAIATAKAGFKMPDGDRLGGYGVNLAERHFGCSPKNEQNSLKAPLSY